MLILSLSTRDRNFTILSSPSSSFPLFPLFSRTVDDDDDDDGMYGLELRGGARTTYLGN